MDAIPWQVWLYIALAVGVNAAIGWKLCKRERQERAERRANPWQRTLQ